MKIIFLILIILMTGCASTNKYDVEIVQSKTLAQQAAVEHLKLLSQQPVIDFKCKNNCELKVYDPSKLPQLPKSDHYVSAHEANAMMTETVMKNIVPIVGIVGLTKFASDAMDAAGSGNSTVHNTSTINGDGNQISNSTDLSGSSTSSVSNVTGDTITKSSDSRRTDNSFVDNSVIDSNDNFSQQNRTAEPYTVNSESIEVVRPEVITVEPVVVKPEIVDPVIVQ